MTGIFTLSIIVFLLFATYTVISRDLIHPLYVYLAGAFTVVSMSIIMTNILDYNITSPIYKFIFLFSFIFFTFFFLQKIIKKKRYLFHWKDSILIEGKCKYYPSLALLFLYSYS